ncbi:hypothetical protein QVD17_18871 [Tagetes erecta]|uniref:Uncharacterized protein n=1 Tax=Tagetes erecta TaxID=13708 RepID=A0AAD8KNM3_TARER|nr:hypothetical protein QVD17_18871 [Tagetes erecta]
MIVMICKFPDADTDSDSFALQRGSSHPGPLAKGHPRSANRDKASVLTRPPFHVKHSIINLRSRKILYLLSNTI